MAGSDSSSSSLARATCAGKTGSGVAEGASSPSLMKRYVCGQKCSLLGKCQEHATATRLQQVQQLGSKFSKTWRNLRVARQSSMRKQVLPGILGRGRPCRHVETCRDHLWHSQQRACSLQKKVASWYNAILHLTYNPCDFTYVTCNHVSYLKALEVPVLWTESCRSFRRCWRHSRLPCPVWRRQTAPARNRGEHVITDNTFRVALQRTYWISKVTRCNTSIHFCIIDVQWFDARKINHCRWQRPKKWHVKVLHDFCSSQLMINELMLWYFRSEGPAGACCSCRITCLHGMFIQDICRQKQISEVDRYSRNQIHQYRSTKSGPRTLWDWCIFTPGLIAGACSSERTPWTEGNLQEICTGRGLLWYLCL